MISSIEIYWIVFLLLSTFFSGMKVAFVASDKVRHVVKGKPPGFYNYMLNVIYDQPSRYLMALTISNLTAIVFVVYFTMLIVNKYNVGASLPNEFVKYVLVLLFLFIVLLLMNEFVPRAVFRRRPCLCVRIFLIPTFVVFALLYPVIRLLEAISIILLRLLGIHWQASKEKMFDRTDINSYIKQSIDDMTDDQEVDTEVKIFRNALDFYSMKLRDCMIPRTEMLAVSEDTTIDALKQKFIESGLSRILVYRGNIDNIIGYIHVWEIFINPQDWTKRIASTVFVPENMQALQLMNDLMQQRRSIAVVVDEFGGTSGLVTMEDLVEEIFGEIEDEYDTEIKLMKRESDTEFILSGRAEIDRLNEAYDLDIPTSDEYTTLAGYLLHHTQRLPKTHETIKIDNYTFKVLKVTERKIEVVRLISA